MNDATIVNLRMARKAKRRGEREVQAAANRMSHGRTLGERHADLLEAERLRRHLDGAQRSERGE